MTMARYHLPARKPQRVKPTPATLRCIDAAVSLIVAPVTEHMSSEEILAERERFRVEADAQKRRQGELLLRGKV